MRVRLLFDLDGTLVDSAASVAMHWRRWAWRHGRRDPEHVLEVVHNHRSVDTIRLLAPELDAAAEAARIDAEQAGDASGVTAMPHAAELLAALAWDEWAIVTSGTRAIARARLTAASLPAPRVLISADDVERGKPEPDGYLEAARRLGSPPGDCVVIEDAPSGIEAGRRAAMTTLAVATTYPRSALAAAHAHIEDLSEVLRLRRDLATGGG